MSLTMNAWGKSTFTCHVVLQAIKFPHEGHNWPLGHEFETLDLHRTPMNMILSSMLLLLYAVIIESYVIVDSVHGM